MLVANAPTIDHLSAFEACQLGGARSSQCPVPAVVTIPPQSAVDAEVLAYDDANADVVAREGATLVDRKAHSDQLTSNPDAVAPDGLHPSSRGDQMLAPLFAAAHRA